ncbi:DUF1801 domain-containing protein [Lysinibacillus sphaericus]|uniref:YdhG-like domain-containing protein n=1 Tax=Lysinibacillus sphaericus OT4b.31 TaxID=1285586 RepID=R7ZAM6_LYSSH|nr:DUF1801 domain-containing protein [Lysinibacillus sphaericus]EON71210.1 hypothetical protein H131_17511 [Lysinibacillus sphaericus OT4b.31]
MSTYIEQVDEKWRESLAKLVEVVEVNLPEGFERTMYYDMISYVVPLSTYPKGYHVTPNTPLPFISLAAQKRHIALYHMGIYTDKALLSWFQDEYAKCVPTKLNMGKSCIRFTSTKNIPYDLIGELVSKMTPAEWILKYEGELNR